ncbi:hypothetical protein HDU96_002265 [Phlyctochytrium bullatum]|nr:hypothetical protein HDU96_002265 [Phlyctochytrium bullatum]
MVQLYLRYKASATLGVVSSSASNGAGGSHHLGHQEGRQGVWVLFLSLFVGSLWEEGNLAEVTCICRSPNENDVAVGYSDGTIRLWKLTTRSLATTFSGHKTAVTALTFDRLGERLASGSKDTDIVIWDVIAEAGIYRLRGHRDQITGVRFLESYASVGAYGACDHLASTSKDSLLKLWDLKTRHCVETVVAHRGETWALELISFFKEEVAATVTEKLANDDGGKGKAAKKKKGGSGSAAEDSQGEEEAKAVPPAPHFTLVTGGIEGDVMVWTVNAVVLALKLESSTMYEPAAGGEPMEVENLAMQKSVTLKGTLDKQQKGERIVTIVAHPSGKYLGVQGNDRYVEIFRIRSEPELKRRLARLRRRQHEKKLEVLKTPPPWTLMAMTPPNLMPRINAIRCAGKVRSFDFSPFLRSAPSATVAGGASEQFRILCGLANNQLDVYVAGSPPKDDDDAAESAASATRLEVSIEEGHRADIRATAVSSDDVQIATCSSDAVKDWSDTLTSRVLNILLRLHHDSLVATRAARPHLRRLRETLRPALARYRDMIGFNLAALGCMRREWEAEHTAIDGGEIVGAEDFFGGWGTGFDGGDLEGDEKRGEKGKKGVKRKKEAATRVVVKG